MLLRLKRVLRNMREMAREFTDQAAGRILAARPQLVGCSSSFQQHAASLALLRRIRELAPDVVTILGGPNCEGDMALAVARACPWVDVVFSGDADSAFPLLCRMALDHGRNITKLELPCGAITRAAAHARARETPAPRAIVSDPDEIPSPVFDDYFAAIKDVPFLDRIRPGLLMETSRGCWWGAKSKCIFCGIHPKDAQFRALPHKRAFNELARLRAGTASEVFSLWTTFSTSTH